MGWVEGTWWPSGQGGQASNTLLASGRALIDVGLTLRKGLRIAGTVIKTTARALRLRQHRQNALCQWLHVAGGVFLVERFCRVAAVASALSAIEIAVSCRSDLGAEDGIVVAANATG